MSKEELTFTIICFGGTNVGISSIVTRTSVDYEHEFHWGVGLEFYLEKVRLDGKNIDLVLFEVGRESSFEIIASGVKKGMTGILLVFDVTRKETLEEVLEIHQHLRSKIGDLPTLLVGNKVDLKEERKIWPVESKKVAESIGAQFIETSVPDRLNIEEVFKTMADLVLESG